MEDVGALGMIEPCDRGNRPCGAEQPVAAAPPGDRAQREALLADLLAVLPHPGRDHHRETILARRPGDRQAMRAEIPVLGHQKKQLWPPCGSGGRKWQRRGSRPGREGGGPPGWGGPVWGAPPLLCIWREVAR